MSSRRSISEWMKNIIIVLLLISAVFLGWQSRLFGNTSVRLSALTNPADGSTTGSGKSAQAAETKTGGEARPVTIAVTDSAGAHYGARYDLKEIDDIYQNSVLIFHDALGTAQTPEKSGATAWQEALLAPGVYFEYISPIRLNMLAGWFDTDIKGDWRNLSVRRLCVAVVDEAPRLYFQEDETGAYYTAETEVLTERIAQLTGRYASNSAAFAFEVLRTPLQNPYALIVGESAGHPKLETKNPLTGDVLTSVLRHFGVSEHLKPITGEDGGQTYVTEDFRIELSPDGTVSYKLTGNLEASTDGFDERGAVEAARQAVAGSIGKYCGEARVYFDAVEEVSSGSFEVLFTYVAAGGRVHLGTDGFAASVTVTDGAVIKMELRFRSFTVSGEESGLMPEIQAAAAAGGAYMLCYPDNGDVILRPSWVVVSSNS